MCFSDRLKSIRILRGLSQAELGKKSGFDQAIIGRYECGSVGPNAKNIIKLCEVLECSSDYLLGLSEEVGIMSPKELTALKHLQADIKSQDVDLCTLIEKGAPKFKGKPLSADMKERIGDALEILFEMELRRSK